MPGAGRDIDADGARVGPEKLRPALRELGIIATRQLAKRQLTWLRSMPERIVIDCLAPDATSQLQARVAALPV